MKDYQHLLGERKKTTIQEQHCQLYLNMPASDRIDYINPGSDRKNPDRIREICLFHWYNSSTNSLNKELYRHLVVKNLMVVSTLKWETSCRSICKWCMVCWPFHWLIMPLSFRNLLPGQLIQHSYDQEFSSLFHSFAFYAILYEILAPFSSFHPFTTAV